jgi:hypothetical protein
MKLSLDLKVLKPLLAVLVKFKAFLVILGVIGLTGYTLNQFSQYAVIAPTQEQIETERKNLATKGVKFDTKTIEALTKQNDIPVDTSPKNVGKTDPFF